MRVQRPVSIVVYNARQCDPKKCTALKLKRFGLVRQVIQLRYLPKRAVVLNPFSEKAFSPADRERMEDFGLVGLDCSWERAEKVLLKHVRGTSRCLPVLIAGNPVNFGKPTKLTTAEALAAALYIAGFRDQANELLSIFKWGHTFLEVNSGRLEAYASAKDSKEVVELQERLMSDAWAQEDAALCKRNITAALKKHMERARRFQVRERRLLQTGKRQMRNPKLQASRKTE